MGPVAGVNYQCAWESINAKFAGLGMRKRVPSLIDSHLRQPTALGPSAPPFSRIADSLSLRIAIELQASRDLSLHRHSFLLSLRALAQVRHGTEIRRVPQVAGQ